MHAHNDLIITAKQKRLEAWGFIGARVTCGLDLLLIKSSTTAEWSSSTILYAVVLLSVHVTQCPVSFKRPRSSCQLAFHQWNVSPQCVVVCTVAPVHTPESRRLP